MWRGCNNCYQRSPAVAYRRHTASPALAFLGLAWANFIPLTVRLSALAFPALRSRIPPSSRESRPPSRIPPQELGHEDLTHDGSNVIRRIGSSRSPRIPSTRSRGRRRSSDRRPGKHPSEVAPGREPQPMDRGHHPAAPVALPVGRAHERGADPRLSQPHRAIQFIAGGGDRDQSRRDLDRAEARQRAPHRTGARSDARNPGAGEGQRRDARQHADHGRLARARRQRGAGGREGRGSPARRRRRDPGEGESLGMGELPRQRAVQRLERARRIHARSLSVELRPVWLELRLGGRDGRQSVRGRGRHRDRRLDRLPCGKQPDRRAQADRRSGLAERNHPDRAQPGHRGSDGPRGDRRRDPAGRVAVAVRAGERPLTAERLHDLPPSRHAARRPHRGRQPLLLERLWR